MRRVCARLRRLNRASSSASERVRLWGLWLSVVRLTGSPHRKKIFDQHECAQKPPQNLSVPRRGASRKGVVGSRCGNDAPWKAWTSPAHGQQPPPPPRLPGRPRDDLGEVGKRRLPQPQQRRPLEITLPPLS